MEKNYKLKISYDGSRYFGWEHQPDRETIQGKIETVLARMVDKDMVDVIGAGRTDAGVHARAMIANVHLDTRMSPEEIRDYANRYLPDDIAILEVREAADAVTSFFFCPNNVHLVVWSNRSLTASIIRHWIRNWTWKPCRKRRIFWKANTITRVFAATAV